MKSGLLFNTRYLLIFIFLSLSVSLKPVTVFVNDTIFEADYKQLADSIIADLTLQDDSITTEPAVQYNIKDANPRFWKQLEKFSVETPDSMAFESNPMFIPLVFKKWPMKQNWDFNAQLQVLIKGQTGNSFAEKYLTGLTVKDPYTILNETRQEVLRKITLTNPELFVYRYDKLPNSSDLRSIQISSRPLSEMVLSSAGNTIKSDRKLNVKKIEISPWTKRSNVLAQFSQNVVTNNWYQGGNSNMSVLGVLTAQLNYDNKKNIQFENNAEWRMGFYFVDDSTALRAINTNNDIIKINSKLGYKINGNWFYSGSVDFSTQLLDNYKAVNSNTLKASFLTPVRLNIGIGLDYKYKKLFSLALSPLAYKYIYVNEKDPAVVNPNLFGIKTGEDHLSEIGSSFKAITSYSPAKEIQLDSKLSFYTNYQKVEIDWEVIGNFTINRYLSTRLSLNPRYDNTVILAKGEKARLQFKELLSFGFSYKLLD